MLRIANIEKRFGPIEVLRGVDFDVDAGEAVALVGDNGAGKSTLMKIITGVYRASGGEVVLDGRTITGIAPGEIRTLGIEMIYQNLELAREQDVTTNIFLGREPTRRIAGFDTGIIDHAKARREAERMVRQLGARVPSVDIRVGNLSGGQQQSVAIARALTFSPKVVIMDEPTAALAVREIEHVLQLIKELKGRGISVILISHRLTDVFEVADRIVALRQGKVIADEKTGETTMQRVVSHIVGAH
ncbi:ATP-binding cassette domain-containing protein [Labrys wisconsinensis]|uniref:Simple sugar transport system ATP-binding protein n=1 Tax=Labrys wisconsinensis TaxID=425677 RepID=A0ABU0JIN8_9HYPH|nr:ATP-binding cassette domain-containing protein [Labrys wisconsinensis]MDQ0474132.1 simple sugar transport system ATP-binding protein [Labrys wisconsinensis]